MATVISVGNTTLSTPTEQNTTVRVSTTDYPHVLSPSPQCSSVFGRLRGDCGSGRSLALTDWPSWLRLSWAHWDAALPCECSPPEAHQHTSTLLGRWPATLLFFGGYCSNTMEHNPVPSTNDIWCWSLEFCYATKVFENIKSIFLSGSYIVDLCGHHNENLQGCKFLHFVFHPSLIFHHIMRMSEIQSRRLG